MSASLSEEDSFSALASTLAASAGVAVIAAAEGAAAPPAGTVANLEIPALIKDSTVFSLISLNSYKRDKKYFISLYK